MNDEEIGKKLEDYCRRFHINPDDFFEIINDQKVVPMLRGKAAEYHGAYRLNSILPSQSWIVNKLNLNAQPGHADEDIEVIHRRTGLRLVIETKSAARGTMRTGRRGKICKVPHFKVKCHRSRSNMDNPNNDQYLANDFDVIITTPLNAIYAGNTVGEDFELVSEEGLLEILYAHYNVSSNEDLLDAAAQDWRFVIPRTIAEIKNGQALIPRTPYVMLANDPNWLPLDQIPQHLETIVRAKAQARHS